MGELSTLFSDTRPEAVLIRLLREAPLAARMRPRTLDEFAGQVAAPGDLGRRAVLVNHRMGPARNRENHPGPDHR